MIRGLIKCLSQCVKIHQGNLLYKGSHNGYHLGVRIGIGIGIGIGGFISKAEHASQCHNYGAILPYLHSLLLCWLQYFMSWVASMQFQEQVKCLVY